MDFIEQICAIVRFYDAILTSRLSSSRYGLCLATAKKEILLWHVSSTGTPKVIVWGLYKAVLDGRLLPFTLSLLVSGGERD